MCSRCNQFFQIDVIDMDIYKSVNEIPIPAWNRLVYGKGVFLSFAYLKALEESQLPGLFFRYVVIKKEKAPVAAFVFQCVDLGNNELGGILNLDNYGGVNSSIASVVNKMLFKRSKGNGPCLMVCGSLLSSGEYGIAASDEKNYSYAISNYDYVRSAVKRSIVGYKVVAEMVKDFYDSNHEVAQTALRGIGFPLRTDPEMIVNIESEWKNFEDYLQALGSKYRVRANAVLKSAEELKERNLSLNDVDRFAERMELLFAQVRDKAPVLLVRPDIAYLRSLKAAFGERFCITGFFENGDLVAFRTCLFDGTHAEAHFIGIEYSLNKKYNLYQNILYGLIRDSISGNARKLFLGRTALEIKSTVGAVPYRLSCYLRFSGRILNSVVKNTVGALGPKEWIPRSPFK